MQEKNEKILGIMANNNGQRSSVDSLIEQFTFERELEQDTFINRKLTIHPEHIGHRHEIAEEGEYDIDQNITELENIIKKLQAEIIEMSATASKPISIHGSIIAEEDENIRSNVGSKKQEKSYASPKMSNKAEVPERQNDGSVLEDLVEMYSENYSNLICASDDDQKDGFDDVRRNLSVLWADATKSSNLELAKKPIQTGSYNVLNECRYYVLEPSSFEINKSIFENSVSMHSVESTNNNAQVELSNVSKFFESICPNDEVSSNNTCDDDKKISSNNELSLDSTAITSEIVYKIVAENIIDNVPVLFNDETPSNLSVKNLSMEIYENNIKEHPSNVVNKTSLEYIATDLPRPGTVAAIKTKMENLGSSDKISTNVPTLVIPTPVTSELSEMQSVISEKTLMSIRKTDSLLKTFNRKLRQIVGITSEKSISQDKNNGEDNFTSDKDVSNEFRKALPKSKSEPRKDFTSDEDNIGPKNTVIPLTLDNFKTSDTVNINIVPAEQENSMGFINIVKKIIPSLVCNDLLPDNEDDPSDDSQQNENFVKANIKTTDNILNSINTDNDPQTIKPENLLDDKPDVSIKNPDPDTGFMGATSRSTTFGMIPKFFGSVIQTEEIMKVQIKDKKEENVEENIEKKMEDKVDKNFLEKVEEKIEEKENDLEAAKNDDEDGDSDEEEGGDDEDDDTYDVD